MYKNLGGKDKGVHTMKKVLLTDAEGLLNIS
jgi:hypothetical protein